MATPSITMIPSGYKAEKVYSVLPTNGDGDFTFARSGSATRVNESGLIETVGNNVPRLDYSNGGCPSLLLEPERRNLILNSQKISLSPVKSGNFVDNFAISPDGTQNATKLTSTSTDPFFYQNVTFSAADYTSSLYVKGIGDSIGKEFGFSIKGITHSSNKYIIPSEWKRFDFTATVTSGSGSIGLELPDPSVIGDEVLVWGWQLEQGSYATSYIPTSGSAVTRSAESANGSGDASTFNSEQGVLYFEGSSIANDGTFKRISIGTSDDLFANSIQLKYNVVDNSITYQFRVGNVYQADLTITANTTNVNKIACVWKINRFEIWVNGLKQAEDTSGSVPSSNTFNSLFFGKSSNALVEPFKGNIKDLRVYNTALTDLELQELTTI